MPPTCDELKEEFSKNPSLENYVRLRLSYPTEQTLF